MIIATVAEQNLLWKLGQKGTLILRNKGQHVFQDETGKLIDFQATNGLVNKGLVLIMPYGFTQERLIAPGAPC